MKFLIRICILTLIIFSVINNLKSQSLEFAITPDIYVSGLPSEDIISLAEVRNKSNSTISLKAKMTIINLIEGHEVYFCLGTCFAPGTTDYEMPDGAAITLTPGESTVGPNFFDVVLVPDSIEGCSSVKMTFMVVGNPSDMIEYTATFCSTTPVNEINEPSFVFAEPMPNPVTDFVTFSYELPEGITNGLLEIYDNMGSLVDILNLNEQKIEKYNTALLSSGTYYAVINIQDKKKAVRKFVVSH